MRKLGVLFFGVVLSLTLAACGSNPEALEIDDKDDATVNEESQKDVKGKKDEYVDGPLTEVGQKAKGQDGSVIELIRMMSVNEAIDMDPIEVTIKDIKLLEMSNIDEERKEYLQIFVEKEITDPTNYIQISYIAENKTDENVGWSGMSHIVLSNGEQIEISSNTLSEGSESDPDFYGKVKKESYIGVPFQGEPGELESIKIVVGSSYNSDDYKAITKEKQVTYEFD